MPRRTCCCEETMVEWHSPSSMKIIGNRWNRKVLAATSEKFCLFWLKWCQAEGDFASHRFWILIDCSSDSDSLLCAAISSRSVWWYDREQNVEKSRQNQLNCEWKNSYSFPRGLVCLHFAWTECRLRSRTRTRERDTWVYMRKWRRKVNELFRSPLRLLLLRLFTSCRRSLRRLWVNRMCDIIIYY